MESLYNQLEILPLNIKEKQVLVTLYKYGAASAGQVAYRTRFERTLVYKILKELTRKHFATEIKTGKGLRYNARDIENLVFEYERKLRALKNAGESLREKRNSNANDILVLEGKKGIEEALYYAMEDSRNTEILGIYSAISPDNYIDTFNDRQKFNRDRGISLRVIFPVHTKTAEDLAERANAHGYNVSCRFGSAKAREAQKFFFNSSIELVGNVFKVYSYENERATIISDAQMVETQRFLFHSLWEASAPQST